MDANCVSCNFDNKNLDNLNVKSKTSILNELSNIIINLKNFLKMNYNKKHNFRILYGGSVDSKSIHKFKKIKHLDGFLIGGASKSSKKFIDIIKNFYK